MLKGTAASNGIVIGKAFVVQNQERKIPRRTLKQEEVAGEKQRLKLAMEQTRGQLEEIRDKLAAKAGAGEAAIFDAHLMMLDDPMLGEAVVDAVAQGTNAEAAVEDA